MRIAYVNHNGEKVDLASPPYNFKGKSIFDWELTSTLKNGRSTAFTADRREGSFELIVSAATEDEASAAQDALFDVASEDTRADPPVPGRLVVGEWYMECWLRKSSRGIRWDYGTGAVLTIEYVADKPYWTREHRLSFPKRSAGQGALGYPHGYPHDYGFSGFGGTVLNPSSTASEAVITVYGPASSPYVIIGGNRYEVGASVEDGGLLVIDGAERTITLKAKDGTEANAFPLRRGAQRAGSGSFAFQPVPPGLNDLSWPGTFGFDILLYERRLERRWSE